MTSTSIIRPGPEDLGQLLQDGGKRLGRTGGMPEEAGRDDAQAADRREDEQNALDRTIADLSGKECAFAGRDDAAVGRS